MRKRIVISIVILFFVSALLLIFNPADFYGELREEPVKIWQTISVLLLGFTISVIIGSLEVTHPEEFGEAKKISFTSHARYGGYALVFAIVFFTCFYLYVFLSK